MKNYRLSDIDPASQQKRSQRSTLLPGFYDACRAYLCDLASVLILACSHGGEGVFLFTQIGIPHYPTTPPSPVIIAFLTIGPFATPATQP